MSTTDTITSTVLEHYPGLQGVYLFGSFGTEDEWPDSDVDIALLLRPVFSESLVMMQRYDQSEKVKAV